MTWRAALSPGYTSWRDRAAEAAVVAGCRALRREGLRPAHRLCCQEVRTRPGRPSERRCSSCWGESSDSSGSHCWLRPVPNRAAVYRSAQLSSARRAAGCGAPAWKCVNDRPAVAGGTSPVHVAVLLPAQASYRPRFGTGCRALAVPAPWATFTVRSLSRQSAPGRGWLEGHRQGGHGKKIVSVASRNRVDRAEPQVWYRSGGLTLTQRRTR